MKKNGSQIMVNGRISVIALKGGYVCIDTLEPEVEEDLGDDHTWIDGKAQGWPYEREELTPGTFVSFVGTLYEHPTKRGRRGVGSLKNVVKI